MLQLRLCTVLVTKLVFSTSIVHAEPIAKPTAATKALYNRFCLPCHGSAGDGAGPAAPWLWPRPRDFTKAEYKWRSTPSGAPPTLNDLELAIRYGIPGTSMHPFGDNLTSEQITDLAQLLRTFAPSQFQNQPQPIPLGAAPSVTPELISTGKRFYHKFGCVQCHGKTGKGDGPSAKKLRDTTGLPAPPYDLTAQPMRRPHPPNQSQDNRLQDIYKSLVTGLAGTPMPSYQSISSADLWALAAYVDTFRSSISVTANRIQVHPIAAQLDRQDKTTEAGYWPGSGDPAEQQVFGHVLPLHDSPPKHLSPAQRSLSAKQCARCHAKQFREWRTSLHAKAASPGTIAQLLRVKRREATVESCQRCHAPLAEQLPVLRSAHLGKNSTLRDYKPNPAFEPNLRAQGINCAGCHLRKWNRLGPPMPPHSKLLPLPGYPRTELAIYERSDFCLPCHQLSPRNALKGKPLLNTYREWLEGPYMRRGIQCQHCHMSNREHTWKGIHDPETFRQGINVQLSSHRKNTSVRVVVTVANVGAGHFLPTTPTPAVWIRLQLLNHKKKPIRNARIEKRIGRHLLFSDGFQEVEDTRIAPGESIQVSKSWNSRDAKFARVTVRVFPDDYYEGFYKQRLQRKLDADVKRLFEIALKRAQKSRYTAFDKTIPLR